LRTLCLDEGRRRYLGLAGPQRVDGLRWDDLAAEQGRIYRELIDAEVGATSESDRPDHPLRVDVVVPFRGPTDRLESTDVF
jgi:hypothetical protein